MKTFLNQNDINRHQGKPAFILGSGPSLHELDFGLLRNGITIAVNSAILKAPDSDYYFTCDFGMVVWKSWLTLRDLDCELLLYNVDVGFRYLEYLTNEDTFDGIDNDRITYFTFDDTDLIMRKDPTCQLIRGSTSTQAAVHFAHLMGCSPIVLLGCDCQYVDNKYHYYDYDGEEVDEVREEKYNNFKPRNLIVQEGDSNKYLKGHVACWQKIREANYHINIIDTSGGKLTMFRRRTLREVVELYGC